MQNEIKKSIDLLGRDGRIIEEGWARSPLWRYDRKAVKAGWHRIKEWDYYSLISEKQRFGITMTMSDLGYAGLFAICFFDLNRGYCNQVDTIRAFPMGRTGFSPDSDSGTVSFKDKKLFLEFEYFPGRRLLRFSSPDIIDAEGRRGLEGQIELRQPESLESMNIATSWAENRKAFYYNRKINCMPASGTFTIGEKTYEFNEESDFGALDWGRGNWTYRNRWFWGSASGRAAGVPFGWNIGYGFSDRTPASENMLFYDGKAHKLEEVEFHFDEKDYMRPWRFTSSDGRFEMEFMPQVDRQAFTNLGIIKSVQHQVFGEFTGTAILDNGKKVNVNGFPGFAEDVYNRW